MVAARLRNSHAFSYARLTYTVVKCFVHTIPQTPGGRQHNREQLTGRVFQYDNIVKCASKPYCAIAALVYGRIKVRQ